MGYEFQTDSLIIKYLEVEMNVDYGKIVTNALSALVAAVFVGAAAIMWKAATSIEARIGFATQDIKATQEVLLPEVVAIGDRINELEAQLKSLNKILAETQVTRNRVVFNPDEPFILEEFRSEMNPEEWEKEELHRLREEIDTRQMKEMRR